MTMTRYVGLHPLPGFTREMLARTTPHLDSIESPRFIRASTAFREGKVVCEWESPGKNEIVEGYRGLGFPYDEILRVEASCDAGEGGVSTTSL
jgi:hypothetical protein